MSNQTTTFNPDWISPPGDTIAELLEEKGWTQADLARRTEFTRKHINLLIRGIASLTPETAVKLESVLGSPAAFWLRREAMFREALERRRNLDELARDADWLNEIPYPDMVRCGWVPPSRARGEKVANALAFFGVSSVEAWRCVYTRPAAAFRSSAAFAERPGATAAWLRRAELEALAHPCEKWDAATFRQTLDSARKLTLERDPATFLPALRSMCAKSGVAVVLVRTPRGCRASGATRFLTPDRALLVLSARYLSDDQLWFSVFHEAGHLLLHGTKGEFLEGVGSTGLEESEADQFAADFLIPPARAVELSSLERTRPAIRRFAEMLSIAPGIVVGRMQHSRILTHDAMNDLKVRYRWE